MLHWWNKGIRFIQPWRRLWLLLTSAVHWYDDHERKKKNPENEMWLVPDGFKFFFYTWHGVNSYYQLLLRFFHPNHQSHLQLSTSVWYHLYQYLIANLWNGAVILILLLAYLIRRAIVFPQCPINSRNMYNFANMLCLHSLSLVHVLYTTKSEYWCIDKLLKTLFCS